MWYLGPALGTAQLWLICRKWPLSSKPTGFALHISFSFLFFFFLQISYLAYHTEVKCLLRNICIKLAIVYDLSVESFFSLYFLQSFSFLLIAYLIIHCPSWFLIFPFGLILVKNKMHSSFWISPAISTFWLSLCCLPHKNPLSPGSPNVSYPSIFSFADLHGSRDMVFSCSANSVAHDLNFLSNMQTATVPFIPLFIMFVFLPRKLPDKVIQNCIWVWELYRPYLYTQKISHSLF